MALCSDGHMQEPKCNSLIQDTRAEVLPPFAEVQSRSYWLSSSSKETLQGDRVRGGSSHLETGSTAPPGLGPGEEAWEGSLTSRESLL